MELMESTSPSSYNAVLELDKKLREMSAAVNIYEDEQFNATPASLEWNCILGANVRQAGECHSSPFLSVFLFLCTFGDFGQMGGTDCVDLVCFVLGFSFAMDAPPIPRHGAPSAPRESI